LQGEHGQKTDKTTAKENQASQGEVPGSGSENVPARPAVPYDELVALYNKCCPDLIQALPFESLLKASAEERRHAIAIRWREKPDMSWWETLFKRIGQSPLLGGKVPGKDGAQPFKASFDWILKPTNLKKILEGNFDNRSGATGPPGGQLRNNPPKSDYVRDLAAKPDARWGDKT
jgi:hypothetical protein